MKFKAFAVFGLTIAFFISPALVPFDGFNPNLYPIPQFTPPVLPAGYAFSLWGIIYLWLLTMAVVGVWQFRDDPEWDATRPGFILSMVAGVPWLAVAERSPVWATVLIYVMLAGAIWALIRAPRRAPWMLAGPLGLYAGWLTAASSVALGLTAAGWGIGGLSDVTWAIVALCVALSIALVLLRARPTLTYGFAVIWALVAVMVRNDFAGVVTYLAGAGALVILVWTLLQRRKFSLQAA
jgi:hypothetical protein